MGEIGKDLYVSGWANRRQEVLLRFLFPAYDERRSKLEHSVDSIRVRIL